MGDYDAFGRKVGEDPLAESGWRSQSAASPVPVETKIVAESVETEVAEPVMEATAPVPPPLPLTASSGGGFLTARLLVRVVRLSVFVVTVGIIVSALSKVGDIVDSVDIDFPALIPGEPVAPSGEEASRPAAGLEPGSLILQPRFERALARLRASGLGGIRYLRLAADRIDVQFLTDGGRLRGVQVQPDLQIRKNSLSGPGFGHLGTIAYGGIATGAPQRFVRAAARRRGVSPTRVDYLVITGSDQKPNWDLFFKDGAHFKGDTAGRVVRRI